MSIIKTYKSESTIRPEEWDTTSSKMLTYHNYNIEQTERQDEFSEIKMLIYTYDVDEYTKQEYIEYMINKNREDIIAVEQNVTDKDIQLIEQEQKITDLDLRLLGIEEKL